jgi:hypothetical protein
MASAFPNRDPAPHHAPGDATLQANPREFGGSCGEVLEFLSV